jgi:hypothetical protein
MAAPRKVPSDSTLKRWVALGYSHEKMAALASKYSRQRVARSTISAALSRAGLTNRVRYRESIPWPRIRQSHNTHYALTQLRTEARIHAGKEVSDDLFKRFKSWRDRLFEEGAVVVYDYESEDGFYYVRRKPSDGTSLVRYP